MLLDLAEIDQSFVWETVARDITVSGWRQQQSKDGYQGLYPDSWSMIDGAISWGLMLGPQRLVHCQLKLDGRQPNGDVRLFRQGPNLVSLVAPGKLTEVVAGNVRDGRIVRDIDQESFGLTFTHRFPLDAPTHVALVGVAEPSLVLAKGRELARAADPANATSGWSYHDELPGIVLKLPSRRNGPIRVSIAGLRVAPIAAHRTSWTFDRSPQGWQPEHDLKPLTVRNGILHCKPNGGDPYLTTALRDVPVKDFAQVVIKCRLPQATAGRPASLQVFWATQEGGFAPQRCATASIPAGAGWHEVAVNVGKAPTWRGMLTGLRIDPPGIGLEIDGVWLH